MSRHLPARYFGRAIKTWRLTADVSQVDLAQRAGVSVTMVGCLERERGHVSEESFAKLCLGLESKLGKPMLATVFSDCIAALWNELLAYESHLRKERGLAVASYETSRPSLDDLCQAFDAAVTQFRACALLWFFALERGTTGWERSLPRSEPPRGPTRPRGGRVRVRRSHRP